MFEDYYLNDPALQGLLAAAGPIMDTPRQAAVMPTTQEVVAPYDLSLLAGLDLSGLGGLNFSGVGGGRMGSVIQDPNVQYITAPVSNKGNPTSKTSGNVFAVRTDQPVRLVDLRTNKVIFEGTGVEAARKATELGQNLTNTLGNKASYNIQTANPSGEYTTVANEKKNKSVLGQIADVALPIAASYIPGVGPVLGAALGSAASSAAQGRSLENTLLRAGLAAGGSALGGQIFGKAVPGGAASTGGINADLIPNALEGLSFGSLTGASIPAGVGGAAGDIIVNAARAVAPSLVGSTVGGVLGSAVASQVGTPNQRNVVDGIDQETGEIVVSTRPDPIAVTQNPGLGSALAGLPALTELAMDPTLTPPQPEDIVVSGNRPVPKTVVPDELAAAGSVLAGLGLSQVPTPDKALTGTSSILKSDDVLGTGLNLSQLISIGGIGTNLLGSLLAGGDGTGTGTGVPYVSPFGAGAGVGIGAGRDMRANPNIIDYERYGFGPEAMFFQPGYGLLNSAAPAPAPALPQAQPAMVTNPRYEPLI